MNLREMNTDEVLIFLSLVRADDKMINQLYNTLSIETWVLRAIKKHCEARSLPIDEATQIMILTIADGVIGKAVTIIEDMMKWANSKNYNKVTFSDFIYNLYPNGVSDL